MNHGANSGACGPATYGRILLRRLVFDLKVDVDVARRNNEIAADRKTFRALQICLRTHLQKSSARHLGGVSPAKTRRDRRIRRVRKGAAPERL